MLFHHCHLCEKNVGLSFFLKKAIDKRMKSNFLLHIHPRKLPAEALRFSRTFGLGGMTLIFFVLLLLSGILLRFYYVPSPVSAYQSIQRIDNLVLFGSLIRNIHYWSAVGMLVTSGLHLLRIFFTRAFIPPRRSNWNIGIALFVLVILGNFTGYLLPWDQLAYWATRVGTHMLKYTPLIGDWLYEAIVGGQDIGGQTLLNFYTLHTSVIPMVIIVLLCYHFWKIRKAGGILIPEDLRQEKIDSMPNLVLREGVVTVILIALILFIAAIFDAPLGELANPMQSPNPVKAPWYFMGFQELLLHFPPIAAIILPLAVLIGLVGLAYIHNDAPETAGLFISPVGKKYGKLVAVVAIILTPIWVTFSDMIRTTFSQNESAFSKILASLCPFVILIIVFIILFWCIRKKNKASIAETIQTLFIFALVSFVILSVIGVLFRGENMNLLWL